MQTCSDNNTFERRTIMCRKLFLLTSFLLVVVPVSTNVALADIIEIPIVTEDEDTSLLDVDSGAAPAALPEGWQSRDIGTIGGSSAEIDGAWAISADGADIWWKSDKFHYVYVPLSGDGTIIARVVDNGTGSDTWAKGGVMIRETLEQDSKHAMMAVTGGSGGGKAFQHRPTTGQPSFSAHGGDQVAPPMWVKLSRVGDTFTGYYSFDGINWIEQENWDLDGGVLAFNPATIEMATDVYIGLFVTSHESGELRTYTFDNVRVVKRVVDVTAPGDFVQGVPNDGDWPSEYYRPATPEMAIDDDIETKYLHFKGDFDPDPGTGGAGFQVTPSDGPTIVTELTFTTANDFPGRDPIAFELSGSNVGIDGPYELIASDYIVDFAQALAWPRLTMNATPISFDNDVSYGHYQLIFTAIRGPAGGSVNSMQIAEVELLGVSAPAPAGADIILVTEAIDWDLDGLRDDHTLETFLVSEGHSVDVRPDYWKMLTPDKIAELNAADLIIFSRSTWSNNYIEGDETIQWNSITTPLLQMNAYFARNTRWEWVNYWNATNDTAAVNLEAIELTHPIFAGVPMIPQYPENPVVSIIEVNLVPIIDPNVASGITSFIDTTDMGNGRLIAKPVGFEMGWIAEWDVGVEFFEGAGQYAGGKRMLFCAGTQEIQFFDPHTQEVITTAQGELNLTAEGLQMFRNAIAYLLSPESTLEMQPEP